MKKFILLQNQTFINLHGKAYRFAINTSIEGLEQDRKVARILHEGLPW